MARNADILQELQRIAPYLHGVSVAMPYSLPEDYFVRFPTQIMLKVQAKRMPMAVPEGYFENFAQTMLSRVNKNETASELEEVAPFLNSIPKTMPYQIPTGYFENFSPLAQKTDQPKEGKVISLFGPQIKKWAVAASIAIGLLLGGWWLTQTSNEQTPYATSTISPDFEQLATVDEAVMLDYLEIEDKEMVEFANLLFNQEENIEGNLEKIETNDLISYLAGNPDVSPGS
jgi:hypothetical protein